MAVTLKLSVVVALIIGLALAVGHNLWAGLFSDSFSIKQGFASMTALLVISITVDSVQAILSGVARGCGWQNLAVIANTVAFYLVGLPVSAVLGFTLKLYSQGLWTGLICGLSFQACTLFVIMQRIKWGKIDLPGTAGKGKSIMA